MPRGDFFQVLAPPVRPNVLILLPIMAIPNYLD